MYAKTSFFFYNRQKKFNLFESQQRWTCWFILNLTLSAIEFSLCTLHFKQLQKKFHQHVSHGCDLTFRNDIFCLLMYPCLFSVCDSLGVSFFWAAFLLLINKHRVDHHYFYNTNYSMCKVVFMRVKFVFVFTYKFIFFVMLLWIAGCKVLEWKFIKNLRFIFDIEQEKKTKVAVYFFY